LLGVGTGRAKAAKNMWKSHLLTRGLNFSFFLQAHELIHFQYSDRSLKRLPKSQVAATEQGLAPMTQLFKPKIKPGRSSQAPSKDLRKAAPKDLAAAPAAKLPLHLRLLRRSSRKPIEKGAAAELVKG
jgi:hypothetical protein